MKERELIILIGVSGSGKTAVARRMQDEDGYEYMNFVDMMRDLRRTSKSYPNVIDCIASKVNGNVEADFVLDGYQSNRDTSLEKLENKLNHHKVAPVIVFADPKIIIERKINRQGREHSPESVGMIIRRYKGEYLRIWDLNMLEFMDTTNRPKWSSHKKMLELMEAASSG